MIIRLLRRCHLSFLLLLSTAQLIALGACRMAPQAAVPLARFPLLLVPALLVCAAVSGRLRGAALFACVAALFGAGQLWLPSGAAALAMPLCCAVLLFFALAYAGRNPSQAAPTFYFCCFFLQCVALFLLEQADETVRAMPMMHSAFFLWLLLFALAFNRISLNSASLARYRLSAGMARTGTVLTLLVFVLALLLCAIPAVVSGVIRLFGAMRDAGVWLLLLVINLFPTDSTAGASAPSTGMFPEIIAPVQNKASLFTLILEKIAAVLSLIVLTVGFVILLRLIALALVRLARRVLSYLQHYAAVVTEDYEDEISDTREDGGERTFLSLRRSAKTRYAYPDTPAGRIRRRYARLRARHPAWADSSTARENLSAEAAALYERARYSKHAPTEQDALLFEQQTQKIRKDK